jgi:hypothetical protein
MTVDCEKQRQTTANNGKQRKKRKQQVNHIASGTKWVE